MTRKSELDWLMTQTRQIFQDPEIQDPPQELMLRSPNVSLQPRREEDVGCILQQTHVSEHTCVSVRCPNGDGSCGCDYLHTAAQRKRLKAAHNHAKCDGAPRPLDAGDTRVAAAITCEGYTVPRRRALRHRCDGWTDVLQM